MYKNVMKKTWSKINEIITKKRKVPDLPKYFLDNDTILTDNLEIANCFNNFFTKVGPSLARSIKTPANKSYQDYLKQSIPSTFSFNTVTPINVSSITKKLKPKTSSGHDGLSTVLLKYIADEIISILTNIINQSLCMGIFPNSLKIAKVNPVFKKGNPHTPDNYRPISLLPSISKVFEKIVYTQVYDYMNENDLLFKSQYGFRKLHSTELAALEITDKIFNNLDNNQLPLAIYLDLSKAFDTIDHSILLSKLHYYGIQGASLQWFNSYLSGRHQFVEFNGVKSSLTEINTGVPQGSILGPLLFIIYMNDIANITGKFSFILYADDTSLLEPLATFSANINESNPTLSSVINNELNFISEWLCLNKLSLNAKKTKMMIFHFRQKNISHTIPNLTINNTPIERVHEFNFLGIILDECLTWKSHVQKISSKISVTIGILNRLKRFVPSPILLCIYNALIQPFLIYGILLWGSNNTRLFKLQKLAVRAISCSKYNSHTDPLFKSLNLLKMRDLYDLAQLKFYHKYKNKGLPVYFNNMFDSQEHDHQYHTRHKNDPILQQPKKSLASKTIRFSTPKLILAMLRNITDKFETHSFQGFSNYAKKYFIDDYKEICIIENCYVCASMG